MAETHRDIKLEAKLGFDRVRKAIQDRCSTEYAADRVSREEFSSSPQEIRHRLLLTDEMRLILMFEDSFPTSGYIDTLPFLRILVHEGSNIDLHSLGKLRTMTETSRKVLHFFLSIKDGVYPALKRMCTQMNVFPEVSRRIDLILDKTGNVKDTASETLYEIRRQIKEKEGAISKRMNSILKKAQQDGYVDSDAGIAVREGKMLLPVNSAFKRRVQGFVFDESSTGKTSFIQPAEIVELENEISELNFAQTREIAKILSEFSDFLRPYVPELISAAECLGEIDFIMAKAQVALDYIAGMPVIADNGEMNLRKARHPLLEKALKREGKQIVPLTVTLTPTKHILLISGPNAGGKSVCLKTTGLLQYMFQWGMLIPTSESSEMVVFDRIMVDIGDGQSIDNDLSTYSSFLDTMKEVLATATDRTLVLIDELGSGTEPTAGGAIAEAILAELDRRGTYGVITTHYTNLKLYASGQGSGVINGAMQFDAKNIVPLFKLDIGLPGNSFAFELARKMGLPEAIVKDAEQRAGDEFVGMERNLRKIVRNRRALDEKLEKIRNTDRTLENITGKYQKELEGIKQKKKEILDQARKEAEEIVKGANRQVENTIRTIKESQAEKEKTSEARKELQNFLGALAQTKQQEEKNREDYLESKLKKLAEHQKKEKERKAKRGGSAKDAKSSSAEESPAEKLRTGPLNVGEKVRIKDNGMVGEVSMVSNKAVTVIVGNISTKMPLSRVERISSNEYRNAVKDIPGTSSSAAVQDTSITERKLAFKPEIDVRGERVSDALEIVMKFIDDAIMLNMSSVRIVHGKGTGALRDEIQRFVKATPGVASVKDEHIQFGGTGVTIVTFE
ncbi:MAG: Smr/MutS family protein [Bacteroidales bacterium]|nr:Smr/MutS family protein [Bacteroidales bacterium]MBQ9712818.1 Smr/MutS family protein [Bacteroidales bacterium]